MQRSQCHFHFQLRMKKIILFLQLLSIAATGFSQIKGRVIDNKTNLPITNASVKLENTGHGVTTDSSGAFELNGIPAGKYTLFITHVGYNTEKKIAHLSTPSLFVEIKLKASDKQLEEVTVTGLSEELAEARRVRNNVMPVTILTAKQIENRASNLNELLARQTGVQIRRTGGLGSEARISIRGLEGKRVQVFIDGNPLNTPDGSLGINDLPLQIIERIEIYKGTIPAWLGGDGLGSAVNVVIRHRDVSYIDATASYQSYNTLSTGLILKKTFDKHGIEAGAGLFTTSSDNDYMMDVPEQPGLKVKRDHDKFKSILTGAAVRFHHLWFDEIEIEGSFINIQKELQGIQRNIQHIESKGNTYVAALGLRKKGLLHNKLSLKYHAILANIRVQFIDTSAWNYDWYGNRTPSVYGKGELGNGPNLALNRQNEFRQQANFNYLINDQFTINLNNTLRYGKFNPDDTVGNNHARKNLFNWPGRLLNAVTGLTLENRTAEDKLLFSAALKHYYNKVDGYNTNIYITGPPEKVNNTVSLLGYNAGVRYNLGKAFMIKGSHERSVRLPNNAELFGDGVLITPAVFLQPEIAINNTVGLIYDRTTNKDKRLQAEVNGFFMNVKNLIQLSGNGLSLGYVNFTKATIYGADAEVKYNLTRDLYASFNVTWQRMADANKYLPGTQNVVNPTYKLAIPNTPQLFGNWSLEYTRDNLIGKNSTARLLYEGSYTHEYNYGFKISRYDKLSIPSFLTHTISIEQSFQSKRYIIAAEVNNLADAKVINNFNQPLPGRTFRIRFRYLLLGNKTDKSTITHH
jgi:vitamin B12 transporter